MISMYATKKKQKQKRITKPKQKVTKHIDPRAGLLLSLKNNTFSEEAIEKVQTIIITEVDESISNDTSESDTDNESD